MRVLDLETDGLLEECTKVHCGVVRDLVTGEVWVFTPENLRELLLFLNLCPFLSCHNGIAFDLKVLKKVFNYTYKGVYQDTLLMSRIMYPDIEHVEYVDEKGKLKKVKNRHAVESWGIRFGVSKPVHEDWSQYTPEMLYRCEKDTEIQGLLYQKIMKDAEGIPLDKILRMEQKVWEIILWQEQNGWLFDLPKAYNLVDNFTKIIDNVDARLMPMLPIKVVSPYPKPCKAFKASGELTSTAISWYQGDTKDICGDFSRVKYKPFNLGSDAQVKEWLLSKGWKPEKWNYKKGAHNKNLRDERGRLIKTSPQIPKDAEDWDKISQKIDSQDVKLLAERNKASHRLSQIKGLIERTRLDHRVPARANTCATNTARMIPTGVVNIPKNKKTVYYGKEMRELFIVPEDKVLVGADASALEARCEGHFIYVYDKQAAFELIDGDIHTKNADLFEIDKNLDQNVRRDLAKSGKYAILYGCSPPRLAATIGKPLSDAQDIYKAYWDGNPAAKELKIRLEREWEKTGRLIAIDGRPLSIRYKHALLNTLLQSCGAIAMKIALCYTYKNLKVFPDWKLLGVFHDEFQTECLPENGQKVGETMVESIAWSGRYLKLNVPLTGEYKIGKNWAECH